MKGYFVSLLLFFSALAFSADFTILDQNAIIHTSYLVYNGAKTDSNGLLLKSAHGYILLDTAWDIEQTKEISEYVSNVLKSKIIACVVTHAHEDRIAGIPFLREKKIDVYSTKLTRTLSKKAGYPLANKIIEPGKAVFDGLALDIEYYGPAHAPDNIVIYIDQYHILYAACVAKALSNTSLGNIADADLKNWPIVLHRLLDSCDGKNCLVIPGHGKYGSKNLLEHTLSLF
jgi:metallo-beta-lactamase class B